MSDHLSTRALLWEFKKEIALLSLLGGALVYMLYTFSSEEVSLAPLEQPEYLLHLDNVEIEDFWLDHKRWTVLGKQAFVLPGTEKVNLTDVRILVYHDADSEKPQEVDIVVTAREGEIDWKEEVVTLNEQVVVTRNTEMQAYTEKAFYRYTQGILEVPVKVDIHYLEDTIIGEKLTYDVRQQTLQLSQALLME